MNKSFCKKAGLCLTAGIVCFAIKAAAEALPERAGWKTFYDFEQIQNNVVRPSESGFAARGAGISQAAGGVNGKAVHLDGKAWLVVTNFSGGNGFTIAAWVRTAGTDYQYIISKGNNVSGSFYLRLEKGGVPRAGFLPLDDFTVGLNARPAVNDGQWHHVAATLDQHALCIYVDGRLEDKSELNLSIKAVLPLYQRFAYIGAFNAREDDGEPDGSFFKGELDEFRLMDSAVSAGQIAEWAKRK